MAIGLEDVAGMDFSDVAGPERFGTSAEFWLNLQMMHALETARREMRRAA